MMLSWMYGRSKLSMNFLTNAHILHRNLILDSAYKIEEAHPKVVELALNLYIYLS